MVPFADIDPGQHWIRWWIDAWRHEALNYLGVGKTFQGNYVADKILTLKVYCILSLQAGYYLLLSESMHAYKCQFHTIIKSFWRNIVEHYSLKMYASDS